MGEDGQDWRGLVVKEVEGMSGGECGEKSDGSPTILPAWPGCSARGRWAGKVRRSSDEAYNFL
jgi:hypothetical protein